jgi:hypothetical protein
MLYRDPAAQVRHNTNIRNIFDTVRTRRFADVLSLLDPAGDETHENAGALRYQDSALGLTSAEHPIKVFVGDLLAG